MKESNLKKWYQNGRIQFLTHVDPILGFSSTSADPGAFDINILGLFVKVVGLVVWQLDSAWRREIWKTKEEISWRWI